MIKAHSWDYHYEKDYTFVWVKQNVKAISISQLLHLIHYSDTSICYSSTIRSHWISIKFLLYTTYVYLFIYFIFCIPHILIIILSRVLIGILYYKSCYNIIIINIREWKLIFVSEVFSLVVSVGRWWT